MWSPQIQALLICIVACAFCSSSSLAALEQNNRQPPPIKSLAPPNLPFTAAITCDEILKLVLSKDAAEKQTGGMAVTWLDGYYAAHAGITEVAPGWSRVLIQGLAGACRMNINEKRPVLDLIAQLHRDYGTKLPSRNH